MFSSTDESVFCIIAPTAYLSYTTQSNTHLVLAHLVDTDDKYAQFYWERSIFHQDRIIMDNSTFELSVPYSPDKLITLGKKCGAHALVLPDYPGQSASVTIEAAEKYIPLFKDAGFANFFVPQSKVGDLEDWISAYHWASYNNDISIIGMSILGIPNALPTVPASYARVVMAQLLKSKAIIANKYHHFLGLQSACNVEIPTLIKMGILNSCDSSNPVWCGINGLKYNTTMDNWMPISKKYLREVDFNEPWSKKQHIHDIIQYNINLTLDVFNNSQLY